ncbi:glycosyltransferase [Glutamicibacter ardleyensis]|uniref:glycosyltransferase n=1 Tax=Glutamicibacter ardleyensis TaxID=225894 RepID=UPI003FCF5B2C
MNRQTIANLLNTGRLVSSNLKDDPSYFALQVARKFKGQSLTKGLRKVLSAKEPPSILAALGAMLGDDARSLRLACESWLSDESAKRGGVFLANLCIASGQWQLAQQLLARSGTSERSVRAEARLAWSLGNMSQAIQILEQIPLSRQKRHYESEAAVYKGFEPVLGERLLEIGAPLKGDSVLFLATNSLPHTGSGYAQRTQSVLSSLVDEGWSVSAATRVQYPLNIGKLNTALKDRVGAIEYERLLPRVPKHDLSGRIQQQAEELLEKVFRDRPAVLHTTTDFTNALAVKAVSEATGIPWVYEVRGQLADTWLSTRPASAANSERYRAFVERETYVAKSASYVLTLGDQMKQNLVDAGVNAENVEIVPNGIGDEFLKEPVDKKDARAQLGLELDAFYVGTVSSLVPYEGLDTVIRALAGINDLGRQVRLLIVGDGTEKENLIRLASDLDILHRCEFTGRVPREMAHLYHAALDLFVVPRVDNTVTRAVTPLKPVEALASGVPVLASDLPALRELIVDGDTGHLVKPEDPQEWIRFIEALRDNSEKVSNMGKSGRLFVLKNRTWSQNAKKLDSVYRSVINKPL